MQKQLIVGVVAVSVLAGALFLSNQPTTTASGLAALRTPNEYADANKRAEALSIEALRRFELGETLDDVDKTKVRDAAKIFDQMIAFEPRRMAPYLGAGKCLLAAGDLEKAGERLEQCILNEPNDPLTDAKVKSLIGAEARASLADVLQQLAVARLQEAAQFSDEAKRKAFADQSADFFKRSYEWADQATIRVANSPRYMLLKASAALQLQREDEAKQLIAAVLKLDPKNERAKGLASLLD